DGRRVHRVVAGAADQPGCPAVRVRDFSDLRRRPYALAAAREPPAAPPGPRGVSWEAPAEAADRARVDARWAESRRLVRRSILIVPTNVPRFVEKAHLRDADAVMLDLEDS